METPEFLTESTLNRKINERLISPFNLMTTFFLRRSVEKAFQLDESPSDLTLDLKQPLGSNPPHITSAVDDIMYIVNKVLQQSLATAQRPVVTNAVPAIARVLGTDFIGMIQRKMRDETYPKPVVPGGQPPENAVVMFLVLINDLDVAVDYIQRIVKSHIDSAPTGDSSDNDGHEGKPSSRISTLFPLGSDTEIVLSTLKSLSSSFESKAHDLMGDGIQVVFNNVLKARLRPILADAFRDIEYQPRGVRAEESMDRSGDLLPDEETDVQTLVRRRFTATWRELVLPIARILTGRAFDRLLSLTLASVARLLEKRIWSYHRRVNALGATRLERDVTGIVSTAVDVAEAHAGDGGATLGGRRSGRYRHREAFARCLQIVVVMGMEEEEWEEVSNSGGEAVDRLTAEERARARAMVVY